MTGGNSQQARDRARERERRAWELRTKRLWTEQAIADVLGMTQGAVSKALRRNEKRILAEMVGQAEHVKAAQTAQLDEIARQAEAAWVRSQEDAEVRRTVTKVGAEGTEETSTLELRGQAGDPRFLDQLRGALADIRKIWGLDSPEKVDMTVTPQKAIIGVPIEDV